MVGCAFGTGTVEGKPTRIKWHGFVEGQRLSRESGKLMLVDFYVSEGCGRCEMMDWKLWPDPRVVELVSEHFIAVRVDIDLPLSPGAKELGKKYDYNYECLLVVCDADGNAVIDDESGRMCFSEFVTAEWLLGYLSKAAGLGDDDEFFKELEQSSP